jgi:nucleoside recognition membrane protein YjiH
MNLKLNNKDSYSITDWCLFIIPSLVGIICFMIPLKLENSYIVPIAYISTKIKSEFSPYIPSIIVIISLISVFLTILFKVIPPARTKKNTFLLNLFSPTNIWMFIRILGGGFIVMTFFKIGPEFIHDANTGGLVLFELLPTLLSIFIIAPLLLPLLISFGLLEFVGSIMSRVMRPIFGLPGRSAVDCVASWLGDCSVAIMMTSNQYENGYYTKKEAAVIATNFSLVSITFALVVITQVGLEHMFAQFYFTVCASGLLTAIIVPRIPPLSRKPNIYITGDKQKASSYNKQNGSLFSLGIIKALHKASNTKEIARLFIDAIKSICDLIISVIPSVMAIGTVSLIISEYTNIFDYLGIPFIPILKVLHIPEAEQAASAILLGFTDMFIPSIVATSFKADITKFTIAAVSLVQLIYLSEVGALLLGSKLPLSLLDLAIIFIQRTLISLPIIAALAHCFY